MDKVRLGLIGLGNIGQVHLSYFAKVPRLQFAAAADLVAEKREAVKAKHGVAVYETGLELIEKAGVDAVLIALPHYDHVPHAQAALKKGLHVLTEKPVAVTAQVAQEAIDFHAKYPQLKYACMFQQRTKPWWRKVKSMLAAGTVGEIRRVTWLITDWFRSQAYYDSGGWRATWAGEGGGVLLNQCPHNLDLLTWFVGSPRRVTAVGSIGKFHRIEVEDDVHAILEFENGATGHFITTTGEAPGTNRLEIAGDLGKLIATDGPELEFIENEVSAKEYLNTTRDSFSKPATIRHKIEVAKPKIEWDHENVTKNFVNAILDGEPLVAPLAEGLKGLELGNAMLMSMLTQKPVEIPTPRGEFARLIADLAAKSTFKKA